MGLLVSPFGCRRSCHVYMSTINILLTYLPTYQPTTTREIRMFFILFFPHPTAEKREEYHGRSIGGTDCIWVKDRGGGSSCFLFACVKHRCATKDLMFNLGPPIVIITFVNESASCHMSLVLYIYNCRLCDSNLELPR